MSGIASFSDLSLDGSGVYVLRVSSTGLTPATTGTINITPGAATQLIFLREPPASVTAGSGFGFAVEAEDQFGNLATRFDGAVTVTLPADESDATLAGPVVAAAVGGVASFSGLSLDKAGSGYALDVMSTGLSGETTSPLSVTAAAASQLVIAAQPPVSVIAGNAFGLSVEADDPYGNIATSFSGPISISLANDPTGAAFGGSLTAVANDGLATFSGLSLDTMDSGYAIAAAGTGLTAATTRPFSVTPAAASKLVELASPPISMTAGADFGLTIAAEDRYGNRATGFTGDVTIALANNPGGATLMGGPMTVAASAGVASFPAFLTLEKAATGYSIEATGDGLTPVTTGPISATPQPATHLVVVQQPPSMVSPRASFGLVVAALDPFGNIDTNFSGQVSLAAAGGSTAALVNDTSVMASKGYATFTGLSLGQMSGPVTLAVTSAGTAGTATNPVRVTPVQPPTQPPSQPPTSGTVGSSLPTTVHITDARFQFGPAHLVTEIAIVFSGPLEPTIANNKTNYHLTMANKKGSFAARNATNLAIRSALYDASEHTVTLTPSRPFCAHKASPACGERLDNFRVNRHLRAKARSCQHQRDVELPPREIRGCRITFDPEKRDQCRDRFHARATAFCRSSTPSDRKALTRPVDARLIIRPRQARVAPFRVDIGPTIRPKRARAAAPDLSNNQ